MMVDDPRNLFVLHPCCLVVLPENWWPSLSIETHCFSSTSVEAVDAGRLLPMSSKNDAR
jgi:hypothetical protein